MAPNQPICVNVNIGFNAAAANNIGMPENNCHPSSTAIPGSTMYSTLRPDSNTSNSDHPNHFQGIHAFYLYL